MPVDAPVMSAAPLEEPDVSHYHSLKILHLACCAMRVDRFLKVLWAPDGVLWSAEGTYEGYQEIEQAVLDLLRRYPEFDFAFLGEIDEIPYDARVRWSFGALGISPAITGMDVLVAAEGYTGVCFILKTRLF